MNDDAPVMIHVERLSKYYGQNRAVNDISFDVPKGEVLGFLGPNGAGKSTTMKILTCYLSPTSGRVQVAGHDVFTDSLEVRRHIGYLPEDTPLYKDMTVLEYLDYVTELRRVPRPDRRPRIKRIGEVTGIMSVLGKKVGELSRGYRQRVGLTQAMVHDPPILILDEPTSGLDPNQIVEIRQLIKELGREKTVILSTHILPEVQATCNRVVIISDGRLVADGTPNDLVAREKSNKFRILFEAEGLNPSAVRDKLAAIGGVRRVDDDHSETGTVQFVIITDGAKDIRRDLYRASVDNGWPLLELDRREASLEEVFGRLTKSETVEKTDANAAAA
jgi:gliding motility-associated transport system ATP-binding protein